jgi:hypothetical protein
MRRAVTRRFIGTMQGRRRAALALSVALVLVGCAGDLQTTNADPTGQLAVPARAGFEQVADAMQTHCGTLDCHGQTGRNMRLFGQYGLRLDPNDDPLNQTTTVAEYDASFASIIGLEPEVMSKVVQLQSQPETLTMVRKPRGTELHKGGILDMQGDPLDRCMIGWLIGMLDMDACNTVVQTPRPRLDAGP